MNSSELLRSLFWLAVGLGALVRFVPVVTSDFPVGDGGLFAAYVEQIAAGGLALPPEHVSFNGEAIPFAYPPLAFYVVAALKHLGVAPLDSLRLLPASLALLIVPVWFRLSTDLLGPRVGAAAAIVYALLPMSFEWLIPGGGITRAMGLLFALLAALWSLQYCRTGRLRFMLAGGVALGLAALSHPEAAVFGGITVLLLMATEGWRWRGAASIIGIAVCVAIPWALPVISRHGIDPLVAAGGSRFDTYGPVLAEILTLSLTQEPYVGLGAILGVVGGFVAVTSGRRWILAWMAITFLTVPAPSLTFIMLGWSAFAGITVVEAILPRLRGRTRSVALAVGLAVMILASLWSSDAVDSGRVGVTPQQREAMEWVRTELPDEARFAVVTGTPWPRDAVGEWFPFLTESVSVGTVQGQEFSGDWRLAVAANAAIKVCASGSVDCLDDVRDHLDLRFDYVFVPKGRISGDRSQCCLPLLESLRRDAELVYDGDGAVIARIEP